MIRRAGYVLATVFLLLFGSAQAWAVDYSITLTPTALTRLEDSGSAVLTVTIAPAPAAGDIITVPYSTSDGTASHPTHYTTQTGTLTFQNGDPLSQNINVPIIDDAVFEGSPVDFRLTIGPASITSGLGNTVSIVGADTATITINDDDYAVSAFNDISVNETAGTADLLVTLDRPVATGDSVQLTYISTNGTSATPATAGSDYTAVSGTLTIGAGSSSGTITIPINNDSAVECVEDFSVSIAAITNNIEVNAGTTPDNVAEVLIQVDDIYTIKVVPTDINVDVSTGTVDVGVIVTPAIATGQSFTVNYATSNGTAQAGTDYIAKSGIMTFSATSANPQTITIPILNDGQLNGLETFTFALSNVVGISPPCNNAFAIVDSPKQITINDNDITISAGLDQNLSEDDGNMVFTVVLSRNPVGAEVVSVDYTTVGGTAVAGNDFTATSGTLIIDSTDTAGDKKITVPILDDNIKEPAESFTVELSNGAGVLITAGVATGSITDDDYTVTAFSDISVTENVGTAKLTVTLDRPVATGDSVKVSYSSSNGTSTTPATAGSDYTAVTGTLTIGAGSSSGIINIPINNDSAVECIEDFSVTIAPYSNNVVVNAGTTPDNVAEVLIQIDDLYTIKLFPTDITVDVGMGTVDVGVLVTPAIAAGQSFTVDYATSDGTALAGTDYTAQSGTLTFTSASANPQTISIPILNDGIPNGLKTFTFALSNLVAVSPPCTSVFTVVDSPKLITINDNDFKITAGMDQNLSEDGGNMVFTVVLNRDPVGSEVVKVDYTTVNGSATAGSDYTAKSGTLTIDATNTVDDKKITVPILDDDVREVAQSFTVKLSNGVGALITADTATGNITDDDYSVDAYASIFVNENVGTATLTVSLDRAVAPGDSVSLAYVSADSSAVQPGDYTAVSGTLVFNPGETSKTIGIPIINDTLVELAEFFTVTLQPPFSNNIVVSASTIPNNVARVNINVDEKYSVSINDVSMQEANADMIFTVSITPAVQADHIGLVINLATVNGTATAPADYTAIVAGTLTFNTGDLSKTQAVTIKEDTVDEGVSESFRLNLTGSSIPSIITLTDNSGLGTILDTDYSITPSWNQHGTVSLESPVGTSVPITSGDGVAIVNNTPAKFTVTADYRIHSVVIDGAAPATHAYITSVITDEKNHTYTFAASTPQGAHSIDVLFDHQIAMTATGPGSVSHTTGTGQSVSSGGPVQVLADHGENETFLLTADGSQCVADLIIDGTSQGAFVSGVNNWDGDTYTFNNVIDNHTIEAEFGAPVITVAIGADDGATGSSDDLKIQTDAIWFAYAATDGSFSTLGPMIKSGKHGESFTMPADAPCDTRYVVIQFLAVDNWTKPNNINLDLGTTFEDQTVEGLYDRDYHILNITAEHGSVTITDLSGDPVGSPYVGTNQYIFPADTDIRLTAVSDPAWFFQVWQGDASGTVSPVNTKMDRDKSVIAFFVQGCQDSDGDGYTTPDLTGTCTPSDPTDCNDGDADIHPNAKEICGDGIDQDCSGGDLACTGDDFDYDGDGYTANQGDCYDVNGGSYGGVASENIHPGAYDDPATTVADEDCYDGPKEIGTELTCSQPSDIPVQAARKPAPPMITFLLDDSGSMDWEFMTSESNQLFNSRYYIYPSGGSQKAYGTNSDDYRLTISERRMWRSQWAGYNKIFFNPSTEYLPWPKWKEALGASARTHEKEYTGTGAFPNSAYVSGYTHADMDNPRYNTYDPNATISAMYHPGGINASYDLDMNAEFTQVKLGGGQQVIVTRDGDSSGSSTYADAVGLSTNANLELTVAQEYSWYMAVASRRPGIVFDNSDGSTVYSETGTWDNSGGDSDYEWENNDRYANANGESAIWKLNLNLTDAGDYYVYAWVDEYSDRDNNALYTLYFYDTGGALQSQTVRKDQSPTNTSGSPTTGARWIRLNSTPIHYEAQSTTTLSIPNAHYYTWYDLNGDGDYWLDANNNGVKDTGEVEDPGEKYLVIIRGAGHVKGNYSLEYYLFTDVNNNDTVEDGELSQKTGTAIPAAVIPKRYDATGTNLITDADELAYVVRQDFADWFSFYRRRILTSKAAVGLTVADMRQVELGLHTINRTYSRVLDFIDEAESPEKTSYFTTLYNVRPNGSTYLRRGLDDVGRYFQEGDSKVVGGTTYSDYASLKTTTGLCGSDQSVFYDANKGVDTDTCDDSGGECQRAYVIAMTDGYYNDGYSSSRIGNVDGGSSYPFMTDSASNSLADFAYYYYNTDLDSNLGNGVPPRGFDDVSHQKMVTYMVSFGVFGYFNPQLFPDCLPSCTTPGKDGCPQIGDIAVKPWTEVGSKAYFLGAPPYAGVCPDWHNAIFQDNPKAIDDLYHASVNGRGRFYNAADPAELVQSLKSIKQLIDDVTGTAASVSVNSRKIEGDTLLFQTTYDSSDWSGDVLGKCLDSRGNLASCQRASCEEGCSSSFETCHDACTPGDTACEAVCGTAFSTCLTSNSCSSFLTCDESKNACDAACGSDGVCLAACITSQNNCMLSPPEVKWSARKKLATETYDSRHIITSIPTTVGTAGVAGIPFRWSSLTAGMKLDLNNQEDLLNYLRGSTDYERRNDVGSVHNYRNRPNTVLGDFINSEPYHYENAALGIDWVFVGGNDGMLHCFDGQSGEELFAYIPNVVVSELSDLALESYMDGHKFYVDGYLEILNLGSKVILVGGLGKGGKGYYALDLTAAAANIGDIEGNAASVVLWEFTDLTQATHKDNIGYSFSRPWIGPSNDASAHKLFVFGNGYDSTNGRAVLFTVGLNASGQIAWTRAIDTGVGGASPNCNGLSSPAVLFPQGDGIDDYIYAGDLLGNMWKFDLRDNANANWSVYFNDGTNPQPLFTAKSDAGYRQPITMQPDVTKSCATGADGYLVAFGTGRLLDPDVDTGDLSIQSAYGIWDWSQAWADAGEDPTKMYLGSFKPEGTSPSAACTNTCEDVRGDATTSGTCIYECVGNAECIEECEDAYDSCATNCSAIRNLSNMQAILDNDATSAQYVSLLRQTQVWAGGVNYNSDGSIQEQKYGATNAVDFDEIVRVVSANEIDWLLPVQKASFIGSADKTTKHVGWYFDLPANGERIIRDMAILNHKLIYTTSLPSDSPCESGGISNFFAVDVCTGGRVDTPFFDVNGDGVIDNKDYINIGTEADPIYVAPSSIQVEDLAPAPTPVEVENQLDRLYFPDGQDTGGTVIKGWGKALQYWRELEWK